MSKRSRGRLLKWKYLFFLLIAFWFAGLVIFFANPKGTQLWLTELVNGPVKPIKLLPTPEICKVDVTHAWQMNDQVKSYWQDSYIHGLKRIPSRKWDVFSAVNKGELVPIKSNKYFYVDTMHYSYPFAKHEVKDFVSELGKRFQSKLKQTDLYGTRLVLTSLLRTKSSVSRLMKRNKNAIKHSSHLHGTTFDISYNTFLHSRTLSDGEVAHLKETLALTLFEMREEKKCYVLCEYFQTCFHVVCRTNKTV